MADHIIAFSGMIGSGKSTLSHAMADSESYHYIGFGDYLRYICSIQGIEINRSNLQILGQKCIEEGWDSFISKVFDYSKWNFDKGAIIDGIRHIEAISAIRGRFEKFKLIHIHLLADEREIDRRISLRNRDNGETLQASFLHESESHQDSLFAEADLVIDGSQKTDISVKIIKDFLWSGNELGCLRG